MHSKLQMAYVLEDQAFSSSRTNGLKVHGLRIHRELGCTIYKEDLNVAEYDILWVKDHSWFNLHRTTQKVGEHLLAVPNEEIYFASRKTIRQIKTYVHHVSLPSNYDLEKDDDVGKKGKLLH